MFKSPYLHLSSVLGSPKQTTSFPPWIVSAIISGWGQENQTLRGCSHYHFLRGTGDNFMMVNHLRKNSSTHINTHKDKGQVLTWPNISTNVGFFSWMWFRETDAFLFLVHFDFPLFFPLRNSVHWGGRILLSNAISYKFTRAISSECFKTPIQEISNRTHWTDPSTWVSNSSIATYWGVRWDSVPFNFWWILASLISIQDYTTGIHPFVGKGIPEGNNTPKVNPVASCSWKNPNVGVQVCGNTPA